MVLLQQQQQQQQQQQWQLESGQRLLEDLAIGMRVFLAIDLDRLLPAPLGLDESFVLWILGIQLGERVAFPIRSNIEGRLSLLSTDVESTLDDGVIGCAVDAGRAEEEFAAALETSKETTYGCRLVK
jgi:hypothetical protein